MRDLLKKPIWKNLELGYAIPDSIHAVSVALPTWNDVINYEEKDQECMNLLKSIYPRFGLNPIVKRLCEKVKKQNYYNNKSIWPYPNERIAFKAKKYIDRNTSGIDDALVRLSIGCEDTKDLISDILFALNKF